MDEKLACDEKTKLPRNKPTAARFLNVFIRSESAGIGRKVKQFLAEIRDWSSANAFFKAILNDFTGVVVAGV